MKNVFTRSGFWLCIFLLIGYVQLSAHAYGGSSKSVRGEGGQSSDQVGYNECPEGTAIAINFLSSPSQRFTFIIENTEVKEEESEHALVALKNVKATHHFALIVGSALTDLFRYIRHTLAFRKHLALISPHHQHLIYRVILI